ncbi:MAG: tripartite tricarboxylate transporter substrate binding protein [Betaproteobacteria bacterium]|nr:tripartite tricarboxylate transporter substrate binding protein [Betaproteobacteria bacterium]
MNVRAHILALTLAALLAPQSSVAQQYPSKPVRIIVPYPPGGGVDGIARPLADKLGRAWNQSAVVENRAGAGTILATELVAKATPDGYTLLLTSDSTITSNPFVYAKLTYDAVKDLAPVSLLAVVPQMVVAHPSVAAKTLKELIALAKSNPAALNYGSYGIGSQPQLVYESLKVLAGVEFNHVPYKGFAPAIQAVVAGEVQLTMGSVALTRGLIAAGKLRPLAIARAEREPTMSDVPTMKEAGFPTIDPLTWFGLFAPSATPRAVVVKLNADITAAFSDKEFLDRNIQQKGFDSGVGPPEKFAEFIRVDMANKGAMIKNARIELQ